MQRRTGGLIHGDPAFAELYQRHVHALLSFIWRYIHMREDAEDVLMEVFLAAMEHNALQSLNEGEQLAWLRRVAHNKCMDVYRRAQRRPAVPLDRNVLEMLYEDEEKAPEQFVQRSEEYALLRDLLAQLPEQQQAVLHLHFVYDLRSPEIAGRLNKSEGSVRKQLARALNHLREMYRQEVKERRL